MCPMCSAFCSHLVLALLEQEHPKPFKTESDASDTTVGSVLTQEHASFHKSLFVIGNTLTSSEKNYSVHDCELFTIIVYCKA